MDTTTVDNLLTDFDTTLDNLSTALTPLLSQPLTTLTTKLPLLERAKAYTLTTYAILSLLFSTLKLNDVDAKAHPVFTELTRCRQYFEKISAAETAHEKKQSGEGKDERSLRVDKAAAERFVRAGIRPVVKGNGNEEEVEGEGKKQRKAKRKIEEVEAPEAPDQEAEQEAEQVGEDGSSTLPAAEGTPLKHEHKNRRREKKHRKKKETPKSTGQVMQSLVDKSERSSKRRKS